MQTTPQQALAGTYSLILWCLNIESIKERRSIRGARRVTFETAMNNHCHRTKKPELESLGTCQ